MDNSKVWNYHLCRCSELTLGRLQVPNTLECVACHRLSVAPLQPDLVLIGQLPELWKVLRHLPPGASF